MPTTESSAIYNLPKVIIGMVQVVAPAYTLYQMREDQIIQVGYAAFALTVTPYMLISLFNCLADVLAPTYPNCYLVRSMEMNETECRRNCFIGSVIGSLAPKELSTKAKNYVV